MIFHRETKKGWHFNSHENAHIKHKGCEDRTKVNWCSLEACQRKDLYILPTPMATHEIMIFGPSLDGLATLAWRQLFHSGS